VTSPGEGIRSWVRFESAETESRFLRHVQHQDFRQAQAALLAGMFIALAFISTDYEIVSPQSFRTLLVARVVFALASATILLLFRRPMSPEARRLILFGWVLCGAVLMGTIGFTRTSEYFAGQVLMVNFILLLVYLVVPLSLRIQVICGLLFTVDDFYLLLTRHMDINGAMLRAMFLTYVLTNIMGIVTSRNRQSLKREQFVLLERETALRAKLEAALAAVKTLEGILPICSYCRKIRNEEGAWEPLDRYVRSHSEAEFSHGICPDCLVPLMRDLR